MGTFSLYQNSIIHTNIICLPFWAILIQLPRSIWYSLSSWDAGSNKRKQAVKKRTMGNQPNSKETKRKHMNVFRLIPHWRMSHYCLMLPSYLCSSHWSAVTEQAGIIPPPHTHTPSLSMSDAPVVSFLHFPHLYISLPYSLFPSLFFFNCCVTSSLIVGLSAWHPAH